MVIHREVEIRRSLPQIPGQRTDLYVIAHSEDRARDTYEMVRLVIEVKANWHEELMTAMESQLVNRYMQQNNFMVGLYLVGWFNCDQWDETDGNRSSASRRRRALGLEKDQVSADLERQAANLSNNNYTVVSHLLDVSLQ